MMGGLALMFLSVAMVTFCIQRQYYRLQLDCLAQDIETSLGVVLAKPLHDNNNQLIESMVHQIFDQDVFYLLQVRGVHNELIISQNQGHVRRYAPAWFVALVRWPTQLQSITVMYDQKSVGRLVVSADRNYAYNALWGSFLALLYWYLFWLVVSLVAIYFFAGWLLRPLQRIIKQANALSARHFLLETKFSDTFEFKQAAMAMNQSVTELKTIFQDQLQLFESLRRQLLQDKLTGFGNRRYFTYLLSSLLYRDEGFVPGFIIGVAIEQFTEFKEQFGEVQASQLIKDVASLCFSSWQYCPDLIIAQLDEGRFAMIIQENDEHVLMNKCEDFSQKIQKLVSQRVNCPISVAVVSYQAYHEQSLVISELDQTLVKARNEPDNLAFSSNLATHRQMAITVPEFKTTLEQELESLSAEPVSNDKRILHQEIALKIPFDDVMIDTRYLMPMARAAGLTWQLDSYVLSQVCDKELLGMQPIAFTLSDATLSEEPLLEKCLKQLRALSPEHRSRLSFEVNESSVCNYFARMIVFFNELHHLGIKLGVKQAGIHFATMSYLNELPLSYLKLHGSLSHDMDENKEFIIHYFYELADMLGIKVIATEIQNQKEWQLLKDIGVLWGQGAYFNSL